MIQILIYSSAEHIMKAVHSGVMQIASVNHSAFRVFSCMDCDKCVDMIMHNPNQFDILFIDFANSENGIKIASLLRKQNNYHAAWAYMNADVRGFFQTLILRPSACILDCTQEKQVSRTVFALLKEQKVLNKFFTFKCDGELIKINYQDIVYFESNARKVTLHLATGKKNYCFTAKLDDLAAAMPDSFLRCHQSYLVNRSHIRKLDSALHEMLLSNGMAVPVSRRMYAGTYEQLSN